MAGIVFSFFFFSSFQVGSEWSLSHLRTILIHKSIEDIKKPNGKCQKRDNLFVCFSRNKISYIYRDFFFCSFAIRIFMGLHLSEGPWAMKRIQQKYANQNLPIYVPIDVRFTNNLIFFFCELHENGEKKICSTAFAFFLESVEMGNVNFNGCQNPFLHLPFLEIKGNRKLFGGNRKFESNVVILLEK